MPLTFYHPKTKGHIRHMIIFAVNMIKQSTGLGMLIQKKDQIVLEVKHPGAFGRVFRADSPTGDIVALKVLHESIRGTEPIPMSKHKKAGPSFENDEPALYLFYNM